MWQELPSRCVGLGHEGERHALLGGDLLRARSCRSTWLSARAQRLVVAEGDLVLAEVALALGALRAAARRRPSRCGSGAAAARPGRCRAASSRRCTGWPGSGRGSRAARPPRRCRGRRTNSSSVPAYAVSPCSASRSSWRRRICRGEATTGDAVEPGQVGQDQRGAGLPRHPAQRGEVGRHREVAVAALPATTSRSRRRCSCRRRRRAGSCSPRCRARSTSSRK